MMKRCCWPRYLAVLVLCGSSSAVAADWPQWGGRDCRNMISAERGLPDGFTPGVKDPRGGGIDLATTHNVRWIARLGSAAYGNPTVANGRVFVGTDDLTLTDVPRGGHRGGGLVKCFDEATGRLLWQLAVPPRTNLPKEIFFRHQELGTCSSPTVENDRVYVVTTDDAVVCLDARGGRPLPRGGHGDLSPAVEPKVLWRFDLIDRLHVSPHDAASCSVLIHGDVLYTSTSNGVDESHEHMVRPEAPAFVALDKRTGRLVAREDEHLSAHLFHAQWSSPSLGEVNGRTLVFLGGGDGFCYAFEALTAVPAQPVSLKKVWSYDCNPPEYRFRDGKPIRYVNGDKRRAHSPNKNDGLYVGPSDIIGTPVFCKNRIYVALGQDPAHGRGRGMLQCIDATLTGDITGRGHIWSYDGLDRTIATATVADNCVYIPDVAGRLHCLDADTGRPNWVFESGAETWGGPLVADGKLYFGNKKEFFVLAAGRQMRVLSRVRLGSAVYSTPIVANGVLYAASQRYLWAVQRSESQKAKGKRQNEG
jgi:outer membrane protein assembly factor BamB